MCVAYIMKQLSDNEYLIQYGGKYKVTYVVSYNVTTDYVHIENIDSLNVEEIEDAYNQFDKLKYFILKDIKTDEIDFDELDDIDFTEIEGYYDDGGYSEEYIRELIDNSNTTTYIDTYSPGDDFETDWFNSLE